jgi:hypothetical protein
VRVRVVAKGLAGGAALLSVAGVDPDPSPHGNRRREPEREGRGGASLSPHTSRGQRSPARLARRDRSGRKLGLPLLWATFLAGAELQNGLSKRKLDDMG